MNDLFRVWHKKCMRTPPPAHEWDFEDCQFFSEYCREGILMHWTGLFDKTKKKIFEGDVVHFRYHNEPMQEFDAFVEWNNASSCYKLRVIFDGAADSETGFYEERAKECVVIGNIYENPKFLPKEAHA